MKMKCVTPALMYCSMRVDAFLLATYDDALASFFRRGLRHHRDEPGEISSRCLAGL